MALAICPVGLLTMVMTCCVRSLNVMLAERGAEKTCSAAADAPEEAPNHGPVHVARHIGYVKPLFGPPTTKLAYARHLHKEPVPMAAPQVDTALDAAGADHLLDPKAHEAANRIQQQHGFAQGNPVHVEHEDSKDTQDAQKAYQDAKMKLHHGAKTAAAAEAVKEGAAHAGGDGTAAAGGGNEVPRHQLDVPRTWKPPKRPGVSQFETRPLVYIYDLPTPLVNCSRDGWASFNYGAEVRLPEVRSLSLCTYQLQLRC